MRSLTEVRAEKQQLEKQLEEVCLSPVALPTCDCFY